MKPPCGMKFCRRPIYMVPLALITIASCLYSLHTSGWSKINFRYVGQLVDSTGMFGSGQSGTGQADDKQTLTLPKAREIASRLMDVQRNLEVALNGKRPPRLSDIATLKQLANELYPPLNMSAIAAANTTWFSQKMSEPKAGAENPLVCPETYDGPKSALGWRTINCTTRKSIDKLVTVVVNAQEFSPDSAEERIKQLISDFGNSYPGMPIIVAGLPPNYNMSQFGSTQSVTTIQAQAGLQAAMGLSDWTMAFKNVHTPMVLVARDIHRFAKSASSLERLVHVLSVIPGVGVVGGAVRNTTRHWKVGCFQSALRNYVLRYRKGYHHSHVECMFCDYLDGPFLSYTRLMRSILVAPSSGINGIVPQLAFVDFFLMVSSEWLVMACPDVMFYAESQMAGGEAVLSRDSWLRLAAHHELNRVLIEYELSHVLHKFTCLEVGIDCKSKIRGTVSFTLPVCCQEEAARAMEFWDKFCTIHRLANYFDSGTCLGAVKMADFLPWDLDGDASYPDVNYTFIKSTAPLFRKNGLLLTDFTDPVCCDAWYPDRLKRSYLRLWSPGIYVEMWGEWSFPYDAFLYPNSQNETLDTSTRMEIHGVWVNGPPNPGQYSRVRYGRECLQHAQSWLQTGMETSWDPYQPGNFKKCKINGHHACLDKFPADGSLAYQVPEW